MAVVDVDAVAKVSSAQTLAVVRDLFTKGANLGVMLATVNIASGDDDGSKYRLFEGLKPTLRPLGIWLGNTAITAGTDYDVGIYVSGAGVGAAKAVDVFKDTIDMSSARASMFPGIVADGMGDVLPANVGKQMYEHAGDTSATAVDSYDIVLTANTVGSANGTITGLLLYAIPNVS